jgi:hypothetical protein
MGTSSSQSMAQYKDGEWLWLQKEVARRGTLPPQFLSHSGAENSGIEEAPCRAPSNTETELAVSH